MNKKMFRYFCAILIFLFIINIGIISASEIDQSADAFSNQILSDDSGGNEVITEDSEGCSTDITPEITNPTQEGSDITGCSTDSNPDPIVDEPQEVVLEKTTLSSVDYVIKNNYLNVYLKDSSKNAIANQKVTLTINGKTLSAITNSNGIAKFNITNGAKTYPVTLNFEGDDKYASSSKTLNFSIDWLCNNP